LAVLLYSYKSITVTRRALIIAVISFISDKVFAKDPIVIVTNNSNEENLSSNDIAAIFTTRKSTWSKNGKRIIPFNLPPKTRTRVSFDKDLLGMDKDAVARYWIDRKIRGGNAPPKQVHNPNLVIRLVSKLDGAIGYVPKSLVNDSVRIVKEL